VEKDASVSGGTANVAGELITYSYVVTHAVRSSAADGCVTVVDDNATPGVPGDDFSPTFTSGDTDGDGKLDVGESWTYTATKSVRSEERRVGKDSGNGAAVAG